MKLPAMSWRRASFLSVAIGLFTAAALLRPAGAASGKVGGGGGGQITLPTTLEDFFQPGTQPEPDPDVFAPIVSAASNCVFCHAEYLEDPDNYNEPWDGWTNSMMGQAARDPVWRAALAIANQDATFSGELCIRCHAPGAWLGGRSLPADGSGLQEAFPINDFEGIQCHFCHRNVNPVLEPDSPPEDVDILNALEFPPGDMRGNGRYVVDPEDVRRGPYRDIAENENMNPHGVPVLYSPFHRRSEMCATCHDFGNPIYSRQKDGTYAVNDFDAQHPTQDVADMFPEQTTYSEWLFSDFADGGVFFADGRFGGNHPTGIMEECQDCHMPDQISGGCAFWESPPWFERQDLPRHSFSGANTWVLRALLDLFPNGEAGLSEESVDAAASRTQQLLEAASDVQLQQLGDQLRARVINFSGHKLPTGYPEGRRMWLNVKFLDELGEVITELGEYDFSTGVLSEEDTTVYQGIVGLDETVAALVNLPAGPSNHLVLVNEFVADNRIPPIGFVNREFDAFGAAPVGATYEDGQYWGDSDLPIPALAVEAVVTLYHQTMTKQYIEFLRDANVTNGDGQLAYDLWNDPLVGDKASPTIMDMVAIDLGPRIAGDTNGDGFVDFEDILTILTEWGPCPPPDLCAGDVNGDGSVDFADILVVLANWT